MKWWNINLCSPSMTVAPEVVSVKPYPCATIVHKHSLICSCVSGDNGAPPDNMTRTRPPINFEIFLKINLKNENKFNELHFVWIHKSFVLLVQNRSFISSLGPDLFVVICKFEYSLL